MKKYYIIDYPFGHHGFFAHLNFALGQLDYAYVNNLIPVVDWSGSQLTEDGRNLFTMLFENKFEIGEVNEENSILCPRTFEFQVQGQYYAWPVGYPPRCEKVFRMKDVVSHLNFLFNHFFSIKKDLLSRIPLDIENYKTLGVHCRRSDMGSFHPENVSVVTNEDFFDLTMKVFNENGFEKLYLATEEQDILDFFIQRIPDKIIYQDCKRIRKGEPVFWVNINDKSGSNISREVLIDALALSKCNSLLTAISGVTYGSIFFNGLKYNDVYYFDEIK